MDHNAQSDRTDRYPFNQKFLHIHGYRIHCCRVWDGKAHPVPARQSDLVLCLADVIPAVQAATGWRCIAVDPLGFGKSDKPDDVTYSLALHAHLVAEVVELLGLTDIALVAEDWGGMHHLFDNPGRYEQAILMETFLWTFTFADDFAPKFRLPFRLMRGPLGYLVVQAMNMMTKKLIPEFCPITEEGMQYYLDSTLTMGSRRAILEFVRLNPLQGKPKASMKFIKELQRGLQRATIPITWLMPTPGVVVSDDHPPSQQKFARFCARFPQVSVVPFGPGHHCLAEENPARVATLVAGIVNEAPK